MSRSSGMITVGLFVLLATNHVSALQASINWIEDSEAGVAAAQKSTLPILFLVLPRPEPEAKDKNEAAESFDDPAVIRLVGERFVAVRLKRSREAEVLLKRLNAANAADGSVVIATPRGVGVDIIATNDVQNAERLAQKLEEAFGKYQAKILANLVAPILDNEDAKPEALLESLRLVKKLGLSGADKAIADLLDRKNLTDDVRASVYDTLAALSTERAIHRLFDAALQDTKAADALRLCTPTGATALLPALKLGDRKRLALAYDVLVTICSIDEAKPAAFWQDDDKTSQKAEIERIKARVATCVQAGRELPDRRD